VSHHDIVAIGASAGGYHALKSLVRALPADLPAAVLITLHVWPMRESSLVKLLSGSTDLTVQFGREGDPIRPGNIYVAPADHHLLAMGERLMVRRGPRENGSRPAIDPMLRSVAMSFGGRAIGVVLTGNLSDGSAGLHAIKRCGGITVVQDPADAEFPEMPRNALALSDADHVVSLDRMGPLLTKLVRQSAGPTPKPPADLALEVRIAAQHDRGIDLPEQLGERSVLTCPECSGVLWEIKDGSLTRFRCHVGHAYSLEKLAEDQMTETDRALSTALRALDERVVILRKLADEAAQSQRDSMQRQWNERAAEYEKQAEVIRRALMRSQETARTG
jgi:two-component system, chemotaxis family, protein-glutamate methylesterase/glutaminase